VAIAANLGFPRIGKNRELKRQIESYWQGETSVDALRAAGEQLRAEHWGLQVAAGIESVPVGDFSFYDHVLDTATMFGAVPERYLAYGEPGAFGSYFAMARGVAGPGGVAPLEMTKWFDTNYHYIVPELRRDTRFSLAWPKLLEEYREARRLGLPGRPVLLGPISLLRLSRAEHGAFDPLELLPRLLPAYQELLAGLAQAGAPVIQLDEPALAGDLPQGVIELFPSAYAALAEAAGQAGIFLASYFGSLAGQFEVLRRLPIRALHLDLVRAPRDLGELLALGVPESLSLSLGVVDGRNVWRTDLARALEPLRSATAAVGPDRVWVTPSCSLLHVPVRLEPERRLDPEIRGWLAFAVEKLEEVATLRRALEPGTATEDLFAASDAVADSRKDSGRRTRPEVQQRLQALTAGDAKRATPHEQRRSLQSERLKLPPLPTTTIGSFPQTPELRRLRAERRVGALSEEQYEEGIRGEIARVIRLQEEIGLDVLVHGEAERNDMVEYFGEQLEGFAVTAQGWVQSYGTRCVKPPIIYGDVRRAEPMTVKWLSYAQSLTDRPVKGMLTGPVTILQWSFVRDDQPRRDTCRQIALAIRDEVRDLEAAGIRAIQIDEPAFREGLPLRRDERDDYLAWAVECFRLATSGVSDETQIHSHMCYSEFNDIVDAIARLDADVISIEASRSDMALLRAFQDVRYPNEIGPGVYDIHSPRVPDAQEMAGHLRQALGVISPEQLWVNPDCGLKTRRFEEVVPTLRNMVAAARQVREETN
jgi:5-methyltetrahydropteroyltriglutamate--homocysteine methyltransferase